MDETDHADGAGTHYRALNADGSIGAALHDAPPYILLIYNLLKTSHDANAVALADNLRVMAETTRTLSSLASRADELAIRVGDVEQNQHRLSNRLDTDLTFRALSLLIMTH